MVKLKVRKFGNSLGVVLPKDVINRLHTEDGQPLFLIEAPDGGYRLTPYDPVFERKMAKAEEIIGRYFYEEGAIAWSVKKDEQISKAIEVLNNREKYNSILNGKTGPRLITGKEGINRGLSAIPNEMNDQEPV